MTIDWCEILDWDEEQITELRYLGYAYVRQGKYDIAQSFIEALVALNPKNAYDVQTLGALFLQRGDNAKALFYLDQALKITPNHLPTLINRTKALLILGQVEEGLSLAKRLSKSKDKDISGIASALLMAYK
jgi:tetratricopeptide (TPR) repeat protein